MTLQEVVSKFNTTPFLFAGSGITLRYYGLPTWKELLKHFATQVHDDRFAFNAYESRANGDLPQTATLIQKDYDAAWYRDAAIRTLDEQGLAAVESGSSPFKMEIASYLRSKSIPDPQYASEISKLKNLAKKNLSGVITTNYDLFFETLFSDYKTFVGQDNLCFSAIQGIAEIYKIHGSVSVPDTIVINDKDYQIFRDKGKYLAAKLMTIFMEYPIIFIGYSIGDPNIRTILEDIVVCIPEEKLKILQDRFVYVDYQPEMTGYEVSEYALDLNGKRITMTKIALQDFSILYDALAAKVSAISVKLLRRFKEEIYTYVITSKPGPTMQVASLDDSSIDENCLAVSIGLPTTGTLGIRSVLNVDSWYRDIVLDDLKAYNYSYDDRIEYGFQEVFKGCGGKLPVHKYLANAIGDYPNVRARAATSFDILFSNTIRGSRYYTNRYRTLQELWAAEKHNPKRAYQLLNRMPESKMDADQLGDILKEIFISNPEILKSSEPGVPTDIRRLIRAYDYLKWGKKVRGRSLLCPLAGNIERKASD